MNYNLMLPRSTNFKPFEATSRRPTRAAWTAC